MGRWLWAVLVARGIPVPPDGGDQLRTEAKSFNWRTQVVASEQSVEDVVPVVERTVARAQDAAALSGAASGRATGDLSSVVAAAKALAEHAQADVDEVNALTEAATKASAEAATKAAEVAKVKIFTEGEAYFAGKVAALKALATPASNPKAENAQKAALPYVKAGLDVGVMVFEYNKKAQDMVAAAWAKTGFAKKVAEQAKQAQAAGDVVMGNRLMIQAHGAMATAQLDEDQAKKIWALAREFNQVIPSYQSSANAAAAAALALPQLDAPSRRQLTQLPRLRHLRG